METEKNDIIPKVKALFEKPSSKKVLYEALFLIIPNKNNWVSASIILIIAFIPAILIGFSYETVSIFENSTGYITNIIIALFGIVFTGYAFFQALVGKELLKRLLLSDNKSKVNNKNTQHLSKLQESNEYFAQVMMLDILAIFCGVIIIMVFSSIPSDFVVFQNYMLNNLIATLLIWIFLFFLLSIIWEMKSFIFNIFQLFNAYAGTKVLEIIDESEEN